MKHLSKLVSIVLLVSAAGVVSAETIDLTSYNCGSQAIQLGMSSEQIKAQCGDTWQPVFISKHERPALQTTADSSTKMDHFEKWMYRSAGQEATHVLLKNDEVIRIFTNTTKTASQE